MIKSLHCRHRVDSYMEEQSSVDMEKYCIEKVAHDVGRELKSLVQKRYLPVTTSIGFNPEPKEPITTNHIKKDAEYYLDLVVMTDDSFQELKKYIDHLPLCDKIRYPNHDGGIFGSCTCGLNNIWRKKA